MSEPVQNYQRVRWNNLLWHIVSDDEWTLCGHVIHQNNKPEYMPMSQTGILPNDMCMVCNKAYHAAINPNAAKSSRQEKKERAERAKLREWNAQAEAWQ